jgi:hypothetical protein
LALLPAFPDLEGSTGVLPLPGFVSSFLVAIIST